ncbi:hypothetical protein [Planctomycetes bacterium CA13]
MGWICGWLFFIPLCKLLKNSRQREIFRKGKVVWAHIIQVNDTLFTQSLSGGAGDQDDDDAPGELVFSLDTSGRCTPETLMPIADKIGMLRGQNLSDPELKRIGDYLEAETVRAFGWNVPKQFTPRLPCFISTTMFMRKHLPSRCLQQSFLPIVVSHKSPHYAMPLPERFWAPDLIAWWTTH